MEFLIMEAVLVHPEKTLSEIANDVYTETGSDFALASFFYYLKRNRFSLKTVCLNFCAFESIFHSIWNVQLTWNFLYLILSSTKLPFRDKTIAMQVRFESLYSSLPSSAKQQREMILKFYVFWRTRIAMANFWYLLLEMIAVGACSAWANFYTDRRTEQIYRVTTFKGET